MIFKPLVILLVLWVVSTFPQEKVYVFYPTVVRPQLVQEKLQKNIKGLEITVFGRYNDFAAKMESEPATLIIAKPALIQQYNGYQIKLNGIRGGTSDDTFVLISINKEIDISTINAETVIGVIDALGRNGMSLFAKQFFPIVPKLKRVTKIDDLLPLLTFNMSVAVLVQVSAVQYFKTTSNLNFVITKLSETSDGIIALAAKTGANTDLIDFSPKYADTELNNFLGIDSWK